MQRILSEALDEDITGHRRHLHVVHLGFHGVSPSQSRC